MGWQRMVIKCFREGSPGLYVVWQHTDGSGELRYTATKEGVEPAPGSRGHGSLLSLMQGLDLHFLCRERRCQARITTTISTGGDEDAAGLCGCQAEGA